MSRPVVDLARERRLGVVAGAAGIATCLLTGAALTISASGTTSQSHTPADDDRALLLRIGLNEDKQFVGAALRALSVVLIAVVALYLFRVIRARNPGHSVVIPIVGLVAFALLAGSTLVSFMEVRDVAREFVAAGPRTAGRAENLLDAARDGGMLRAANIVTLLASLMFGIWVSLASYEGMRVGLLTRFLGVFGIGAGVTSAIGVTALAAALFMGWVVSVALLALGWWPGGRPPAWDQGPPTRAIPVAEAERREAAARGRT